MKEVFRHIARQMMLAIAHDNGAINRIEDFTFKEEHLQKITKAVEYFLKNNPNFDLTYEVIQELCIGEEGEVKEHYGLKVGFDELNEALNNYFEDT